MLTIATGHVSSHEHHIGMMMTVKSLVAVAMVAVLCVVGCRDEYARARRNDAGTSTTGGGDGGAGGQSSTVAASLSSAASTSTVASSSSAGGQGGDTTTDSATASSSASTSAASSSSTGYIYGCNPGFCEGACEAFCTPKGKLAAGSCVPWAPFDCKCSCYGTL